MSGHHKHLSSDPKHHQLNTSSTNQTTTQEITLKSTPRNPGQEIHSPIHLRTSQATIQIQEQKSDAHLCITSLRGERAGARRQPTHPCGDLGIVSVILRGY
jgi:hypothetical protein